MILKNMRLKETNMTNNEWRIMNETVNMAKI